MNIYVGNISRDAKDEDLRQAFEAYGQVASATIMKDKFTGEIRGFGFVEMPSADEAEKAINAMNGKEFKGRNLVVNEARPRTDSRPGGGGGGGGPRRSGGGGGGGNRRF